jgi:protein-S-isoprenylcysteine O-methyltransferase Ste14
MRGLELAIPPPAVVGIVATLMAAQAWWFPLAPFGRQAVAAIAVALASLALAVAAVWSFRRAGTTVNPLHPDRASVLVTTGAFRYSRNPIYVADAMLLAAWALWLGEAAGFAGVPLFVAYVTRFQVVPEERALRARFGEAFTDYAARTRRWVG